MYIPAVDGGSHTMTSHVCGPAVDDGSHTKSSHALPCPLRLPPYLHTADLPFGYGRPAVRVRARLWEAA